MEADESALYRPRHANSNTFGFNSRPFCVQFVIENVAVVEVFLRGLPRQHHSINAPHSPPTYAILRILATDNVVKQTPLPPSCSLYEQYGLHRVNHTPVALT